MSGRRRGRPLTSDDADENQQRKRRDDRVRQQKRRLKQRNAREEQQREILIQPEPLYEASTTDLSVRLTPVVEQTPENLILDDAAQPWFQTVDEARDANLTCKNVINDPTASSSLATPFTIRPSPRKPQLRREPSLPQ